MMCSKLSSAVLITEKKNSWHVSPEHVDHPICWLHSALHQSVFRFMFTRVCPRSCAITLHLGSNAATIAVPPKILGLKPKRVVANFCGLWIHHATRGDWYPLVMTNSSPWYRWRIEIDGLPNLIAWGFSMAMLVITRWYLRGLSKG